MTVKTSITNVNGSATKKMAPNASKVLAVTNLITSEQQKDQLYTRSRKNVKCSSGHCCCSLLEGQVPVRTNDKRATENQLLEDALEFLQEYFAYTGSLDTPAHQSRVQDVTTRLLAEGKYELTSAELTFGARQAWRNSPASLDRVLWEELEVRDCTHVRTAKEMFHELCFHLKSAANNGETKPTVTIFPPRLPNSVSCRIWNDELLGYAGYELPDGTIRGDPANLKFTQLCQSLGWQGTGSAFDVLPLVLNGVDEDPQLFVLPQDVVRQVNIRHPDYPWFEQLGLRWFSIPSTSCFLLDVGGVEFPSAPLTGIAMSSDIASRHLSYPHRYNMLQTVAEKMFLDTSTAYSLWKDHALVEINIAVIYSFRADAVTIWDHHQASDAFVSFLKKEFAVRGGCPGDWTRLVSPINSSITSVFHQEMLDYSLYPSYVPQIAAIKAHKWQDLELEKKVKGRSDGHISFRSLGRAAMFAMLLHKRCLSRRVKTTVLYASETGRAESFAKKVASLFEKAYNVRLMCMKDYDINQLTEEQLLLIVTSTFGSGDAPGNGQKFWRYLSQLCGAAKANKKKSNNDKNLKNELINSQATNLQNVKFSVFALGSSAYPDFCQFGKSCHKVLESFGAQSVLPVATADEIKGQEVPLRKWMQAIFKKSCQEMNISVDDSANDVEEEEDKIAAMSRLVPQPSLQNENLCSALARLHKKEVASCRVLSRTDLQSTESSERTILICLDSKTSPVLDYEPGDHIGVFPVNDKDTVDYILERLVQDQNSLNQVMQVHAPFNSSSYLPVERLPNCNLRTAFKCYLDVSSTPSQTLLKYLSTCTKYDGERQRLDELAKDEEAYNNWRALTAPGLRDVLQEFPNVQPSISAVMMLLPLLQPRFYSVSSSPAVHPGQIHLTVGITRFRGDDDAASWKNGVCTSYMDRIETGKEMICFVRRAPTFHLPSDISQPIVMIGSGTGLAPFRSFWQQRKFDKSAGRRKSHHETGWRAIIREVERKHEYVPSSKLALYFGCRHPNQDDIYRKEIVPLYEKSVLTGVRTAFSRLEGLPKQYVQTLLEEDSRDIYRHLTIDQGHLYVCGSIAMAAGVRAAVKHILQTKGIMTEEDADQYLNTIKAEGRYHEDIFGTSTGK